MEEFVRFCSNCGKKISYARKSNYKLAESKNRKCKSYSRKGKPHLSEDSKKRIGELLKGRKFSEETKAKMSKSHIGKKMTEEYKAKISEICKITQPKGEKSHNYGKKASEETREKMSKSRIGKIISKETREKISKANKGKIRSDEYKLNMSIIKTGKFHTEESKLKMRTSRIKEIESKCGRVIPNYNKTACQYFNKIMEQTKVNIQHAENGGEYYIKGLGYWVDGYDIDNNIVYEYDEKRHFDIHGNLNPCDIKRENEIMDHLKCKIIRIKE